MTAQTEMLVEERLFIDGQLRTAAAGRTYPNVNPATEEVVGIAADATAEDMLDAIRAARTAFDNTGWAADAAFRARCLRQLHEALLANAPAIRETVRAEVGATDASLDTALFDRALDNLTYAADLAANYEFVTDMGIGESMGMMSRRWLRREPVGVTACITPWNAPMQVEPGQGGVRARRRVHRHPQAGPRHAVERHRAGPAGARGHRHPGRRLQRRADLRQRRRPAAGRRPAGRPDQLHRVDGGRPPPHGRRRADGEEGLPGTRRQVGLDRVRRRRPRRQRHDGELTRRSRRPGRDARSIPEFSCSARSTRRWSTSSPTPFGRCPTAIRAIRRCTWARSSTPASISGCSTTSRSARRKAPVWSPAEATRAPAARVLRRADDLCRRRSRFAASPRRKSSVRSSASSRSTRTTRRCGSPIPPSTAWRAASRAQTRARARAIAERIRSGVVNVNGGMYYSCAVPFGGYKQSGIGREMGTLGLEEYTEVKVDQRGRPPVTARTPYC